MASDFFRVERGYEITDTITGALTQILQGTAAPGAGVDEQDAPVGSIYIQHNGSSSAVWQKYRDVSDNNFDWRTISSSISWREPARVRDNTLYANSAAFPITGTIDSVVLADGDRVLFSNVTAPNESNVWIWQLGTTSWLQDSNAATDGDALFIQQGTSADQAFFYNGTAWVQFGSGSAAEETFIRAFIGKDAAGAETPDYTNPTGGGPFTVGNIIGNTDNLELALAKLNAFVYENNRKVTATATTSASDTLPVGLNMALWMVRVNSNATPANVRARLIFAIRNNANGVDFSSFALLTSGGAIAGLNYDVTSAGNALTLTVTTSGNADYEIHRIATF